MRLYDNAWPAHYEEIKTWYPVWYREVLEMDALWRVWGSHLDEVREGIIRAVDNNFIDTADAPALSKLEAFFGITYDVPHTLEERRDVIRALIVGRGQVGRPQIIEIVEIFTDGQVDVAFVRPGQVIIEVIGGQEGLRRWADILHILNERLPAHLSLGFSTATEPVETQVSVIGKAFPTSTSTKLPKVGYEYDFNTKIEVPSAAFPGITSTTLPNITGQYWDGKLLVDGVVEPGFLEINGEEIAQLYLKSETEE